MIDLDGFYFNEYSLVPTRALGFLVNFASTLLILTLVYVFRVTGRAGTWCRCLKLKMEIWDMIPGWM